MNPYDAFFQIRGILLDIDGVCTDNTILVTDHGELLRMMNVRDGYAIKKAIAAGIKVGIISGGRSEGTKHRFELLGVRDIYPGIEHKLEVFHKIIEDWGLTPTQIAYMGDDILDLPVLKASGLSACPSDAVPEVLQSVQYISPLGGGKACVRDLIEKILQAQDKW